MKTMYEAIGIIELSSVGIGYAVQDAMLKAADVRIVLARTICSGKYIVIVSGKVAETEAAVEAGLECTLEGIIDSCVIPRVHPDVFKSLGGAIELCSGCGSVSVDLLPKAIGVVETFTGTSILQAADVAAKAASVTLFRLHTAMAMGGKGFLLMAGTVSDVQTAVEAAATVVRSKGLLVSAVTIPGPSRELFGEYL